MKLPVTLRHSSTKDCLGVISAGLLKNSDESSAHGLNVFLLSCNDLRIYLSLIASGSKESDSKSELFLNRFYSSKLGIADGSNVLVERLDKVASCTNAWIEPLSVDDWEILELHAGEVEMQLLDQIRIIWPGQTFPLWVDKSVCIFLKTVKIEPPSDCAVLIPLTELYIKPKVDRNSVSIQRSNRTTATPTNQSLQKETTLIPMENGPVPGTINSQSKLYRLYKIVKIRVLYRFYDLVKCVLLFIWRQFPLAFYRLRSLIFPSVGNSLPPGATLDTRQDWLRKYIDLVPTNFTMVMRVEPVIFGLGDSSKHLSNQPSSIFLQTRHELDSNSDIFLVLLSKIRSPTEKNHKHVSKKAAALGKKSHIQHNLSKNESNSETADAARKAPILENCVVRMYFQSLSKYAMIPDWNVVCSTYKLKVPSCVRRQMNLSVSSKVRLQKLSACPQLPSNIKSLSLDIISSEPSLPKSVNFEILVQSFREWLDRISSGENPIPVTVGSLLVFPISNFVTESTPSTECSFIIDAIITGIEPQQKSTENGSDPIANTYLLSSDELGGIEINFSYSNCCDSVAFQTDVDLQLPEESLLIYSKGLESEVNSLEYLIEIALASRPLVNTLCKSDGVRPTCCLVTGAKGTGKTVLCRSILRKFGSDSILHAYVRSVSCGMWRGKKPENVKKHCDNLLYELLWRQPSILLLDDLDQLTPSTGGSEEQTPDSVYTLQLVSVIKNFLQCLSGKSSKAWMKTPQVAILITAKDKSSMHASMTCTGIHLFSKTIHIELPDLPRRSVLLNSLIRNFTPFQCPEDLHDVLEKTEGFAAADLLGIVQRSTHLLQQKKCLSRHSDIFEDDILPSTIIKEALVDFTPASLQNAKLHKPSPLTWEDVGGLKGTKQKLTEQLVWPVKYKHVFEECGLQAQSGVLLFGPPGCGKTLLAGVVASECNLNFISIKGPEVLSKYIGASEAAVRDLFSRAKAAAPCVLFFDEFDSLAPKRGHDSTGVTDRVVNQLLTHLDGVEPLVGVTVMAASNRPDLLDPALLRPGRLDSLLYCPLPDVQERHEILISLSRNLSINKSIDLSQLAEQCENFSGADLKALLYNAQLDAVHEGLSASSSVPCNPSENSYPAPNSLSPVSSSSIISCGMENDDMYLSNGMPEVEKYEPTSSPPLSPRSIDDLKNTAVGLIQSIQHRSDDRQFDAQNSMTQFNKDSHNLKSKVVYFPSVHEGPSENIPPDILDLVETISQRFSTGINEKEIATSKKVPISLLIEARHIESALNSTSPSISSNERANLGQLYSGFIRSKERTDSSEKNYYTGVPRATLS